MARATDKEKSPSSKGGRDGLFVIDRTMAQRATLPAMERHSAWKQHSISWRYFCSSRLMTSRPQRLRLRQGSSFGLLLEPCAEPLVKQTH